MLHEPLQPSTLVFELNWSFGESRGYLSCYTLLKPMFRLRALQLPSSYSPPTSLKSLIALVPLPEFESGYPQRSEAVLLSPAVHVIGIATSNSGIGRCLHHFWYQSIGEGSVTSSPSHI